MTSTASHVAVAPSDLEFVSHNLSETNKFFSDAFSWKVIDMKDMSVVNWGLKLVGMVRKETDVVFTFLVPALF